MPNPTHLPNIMHLKKGGRDYFYFRRVMRSGNRRTVRLPNPFADPYAFKDAYSAARLLADVPATPAIPETIDLALALALRRARDRSKRKGRTADLTIDDLRAKYISQQKRCALTSEPFQTENPYPATTTWRNPMMPSIDRIDPAGGYTVENTQLVTLIANIAKSDFGAEAFYDLCMAGARHHRRGRTKNESG